MTLCPFSKPIIGNWCQCEFAHLHERCSGKMTCLEEEKYLSGCVGLVDLFKEKSRFILGITSNEIELTHMQLMKIRCGGLLGMQRILSDINEAPEVLNIIELSKEKYGDMRNFPFNEIVQDIKGFSHRNKRANKHL